MSPREAQQEVYKPSDRFLRRIDRLEKSSTDFPGQLVDLFEEKDYNFAKELQDEDQDWLVEYLDNVCSSAALYPRSTESTCRSLAMKLILPMPCIGNVWIDFNGHATLRGACQSHKCLMFFLRPWLPPLVRPPLDLMKLVMRGCQATRKSVSGDPNPLWHGNWGMTRGYFFNTVVFPRLRR